jgi:hydrogenase expression/formation protein HypC
VPEAAVGDWVLVHAGCAITVLAEHEARETLALLSEVAEFDSPAGSGEDEG